MSLHPGNLLGAPRAEADRVMLERAFVETKDFLALAETDDFNFVVGRRGTGKSALFGRLTARILSRGDSLLCTLSPEEHEAVDLNGLLARYGTDYVTLRRIAKLLWRAELLFRVLASRHAHYKGSKLDCDFLISYSKKIEEEFGPLAQITRTMILRRYEKDTIDPRNLPARIAADYHLDRVETTLSETLAKNAVKAVVLCDRLDEGWLPDSISTAALGGLANAAASFIDKRSPIQVVLFIRDNMFRALSHIDSDFSRNIEGNTLRLSWSKESLFHFVAERLRVALNITDTENDTKVWNRFAQRELRERDGFETCLQSTLYRPRDILVLLNAAYRVAGQDQRDSIIPLDIETSAHQISNDRLRDLLKEYDEVLPGLRLFVDLFRARSARGRYGDLLALLGDALGACDFSTRASADFSLLETPSAIFDALYGVGFIGIKDPVGTSYQFCHDGAPTSGVLDPARETVVHPCYWKALGSSEVSLPESIVIEVNDEYDAKGTLTADFRAKRLGTVVSDLGLIPLGVDGQTDFENWVFRAIKLLFPGQLSNIQVKPNADAVQRRDVVATNSASSGFWKRIHDDYRSRQVVFEMKNFEDMGPDEFRQASTYLTGEYGTFGILVTRSRGEGLSPVERGWVKEIYDTQSKLIMLIPATMLARALGKIRSPKKKTYADEMLSKRMDTFIRSYLSLRHQRTKRTG